METKPIGKVCLTPKGDWDQNATYDRLDVVYLNGSSYISKKDKNNNRLPIDQANESYWMTFVTPRGPSDIQVTDAINKYFQNNNISVSQLLTVQEYSQTTYSVGALVTYTESGTTKIYRCKTAIDTGEEWNSEHWEEIYTSAIVDDTLSISGAAANAKKTGDLFAPVFSTSAYSIGDYVLHNGKLYRFKAAHGANTDWSSSEVDEISVTQELNNKLKNLANVFSSSTSYSTGNYVIYNGQLYVFTANHAAGAWTGSDTEAVTVCDKMGMPLNLMSKLATTISGTSAQHIDLDDYTTAGNYRITSSNAAGTIDHLPDTKAGRLFVMTTTASTNILQVYICHVSTVYRVYIRSKNGSTAAWSDWTRILTDNLVDTTPTENSTHLITSGGVFSSINPKSYTVAEADAVAEKVRNVQTGTSLTFLSISDLHIILEDETNSNENSNETIQAAPILAALDDMRQGVKAVLNQLHVDYCVCFGDIIYRMSGYGGFDKGAAEMLAATKIINDAFGTHKQLRLVGNHDPNAYDETRHYTTAQLNAFFGAYSEDLVKDLYPYGSFGYKDFETQRVRLIVLNTSFFGPNTSIDQNVTVYKIGNNEALWLAQHLDLSAKEDAEDWQIVIFSHVPLDIVGSSYKALGKYSAIIDAYFKGSEWVSTSDYRYDFAGKNTAKLALYVNGHAHRYRVQNFLNVNSSGAVANTTELAQLFIANALPGRDSESVDGQTYTKTPNTAQSTAFQVVTIDFENKIAWAHHFGAGIDMMVHYEPSTNASLSTDLTSPTWFSVDSSIAIVSGGVVTPVAAGNVMIGAKSADDGMIEFWNFISEV